MRLYIANCTRQIVDFAYRLPEVNGIRSQPIGIGGQIQVAGDLSTIEVDAVIKQHAKYGMISVDEIDRTKPFAGLCYAVDRRIAVEKVMRAMEHNQEVLHERGREMRQQAAVAASNLIDSHLRDSQSEATLENFEMTVKEEPSTRRESDDRLIEEGITVDRNADPGAPTVKARRERQKPKK